MQRVTQKNSQTFSAQRICVCDHLRCSENFLVLSLCTGSQEPIQKTQQCSTLKQRFIKKGVQWLFPRCTGTPGHNPTDCAELTNFVLPFPLSTSNLKLANVSDIQINRSAIQANLRDIQDFLSGYFD